ncbi:c-type cytochrome [Marinomonas sp. 15G1-11]|uniref:C-type cytochrome n=1 Tax=Marinomonas phaeophyticola TaxID=3004091 RepID=A0ABT4JZ15_9GAMM|nr:c-type cytochrome [Marinomonas sp. 15G1-11]MCZ2723574.1 c-type cytochrome [Marinomonas sp. 15G1-11]
MKKVLVGMLVAVGATSVAMAQGNADAGKELTAVCAACHAADGNSLAPTFPKLAGQQEKYLLKQLTDIKSGNRKVTEMTGLLDNLTDQNLADIAAYFANNSVVVGQADAALVEAGKAIYRTGNPKTGVPACTACHGPTGQGLGSAAFPALSGQHADYTKSQLKAFQTQERSNDPANIMRGIAFKMNDREIEAVASYIQGLY